MIIDGFKLTLVGMAVVFGFLLVLMLLVQLSARLLKPLTDKEALEMTVPERKASLMSDKRLAAVIGAAVSFHRARRRKMPDD